MKYIIGVDGGGTKTEIVVCDTKGNVIAREIGGSSNPNDVGKEKMFAVICDLIDKALPSDCDSADIGLGISGIFVANCEEYLRLKLKEKFSVFDRIEVISDKDSAFNCAYDGDGCIIIIGTGSVGLVKTNGVVKNLGGGGYLIDDALSGFDLGREVLNAVLCANDGIGEKTVLTDMVFEKTGENIRTHLKVVYQKGKAYVASFAPLVFDALEKSDKVAENIMKKCVSGFERLALGVYKSWSKEKCEIMLFGGLSKRLDVINRFLSDSVTNKIIFKLPEIPIIYGLLKEFVIDKSKFLNTFLRSYNSEVKQ